MWNDGDVVTCPHCSRECIIQRNKPMDMISHKLHTCEQYLTKVKTGLIKPKKQGGLQRLMMERNTFTVQRFCGWCGAKWVYSEHQDVDNRLYLCPQCEKPGSKFEHPVYGNRALVKWAEENGKIIPDHLKKYLK